MKMPLTPPIYNKLIQSVFNPATLNSHLLKAMGKVGPLTESGEYIHWDKLRHLKPPDKLSTEEWWCLIKMQREGLYRKLPFQDKYGSAFVLAMPDFIWKKLHDIDLAAGAVFNTPASLNNTQVRDNYLTQSFIEEAITSSQLEGASTTRKVAKEMLRTMRKPANKSEQMIYNNYQAMQFVREMKDQDLTIKIILELHHILTKKTLEDHHAAGELRKTNDIHVVDNRDNTILHTPPDYEELEGRLKKLCQFANEKEQSHTLFFHPVIKAIMLHFMLAYDHPFVDGNGRTARALFYWAMSQQKYWMMEYISISSIIKKASSQYAKSFLYTETDGSDVTYFIDHQLDVISDSIKSLHHYIEKQYNAIKKTEALLFTNNTLRSKLNFRQVALIKHALKHPGSKYLIQGHREAHQISYQTARTDLISLAELGLLQKGKEGSAFVYFSPANLRDLVSQFNKNNS